MLTRCPNVFGGFQHFEADPEVRSYADAFVRGNALYDRNRALIPASALLREYGPLTFPDAGPTSNHNPALPGRIIEEPLYWIGQFHTHFGHYLISTLPRLWARQDYLFRIGYTGNITPGEIFSIPFAAKTLSALGIGQNDLVNLRSFDMIKSIVVAGSAFIENSAVYSRYHLMNTMISRNAGPSFNREVSESPIYLSKGRLKAGVSRILNEDAVTDILAKRGVQIVYPEELSFAAQIRLWDTNTMFIGYAGSALHLAAFSSKKKIISLNHARHAESNQILIDTVSSHQSAYLYPHQGVDFLPAADGFHRLVQLRDPVEVAEGLLRTIDIMARDPGTLSMHPRPARETVSRFLYPDEPFGFNISRGKQARISSSDPAWQIESPALDAQRALSGRLSSTYQFHTLNEQSPWWDVDLGQSYLVNEIRIFNRNDAARWRATRLQILVSKDGTTWDLMHERSVPTDFGGVDTDPYRWLPADPLIAKHVRIQLPTHDMLHLNQIEVFGYQADSVEI